MAGRLTFRSKVDSWLFAMLLMSAGVSAMGVYIVDTVASPSLALAVAPLLLLTVGLPVWLLLATRYTFDAANLEVRCGPFAWRVPLSEIRAVTPTDSTRSGPALSLDRLRIDFGPMRSILISPRDKEAFVRELGRRVPALGGIIRT